MNEMKWGQILKRNKELGMAMSGRVRRIALLSNTTVFQLKDILELNLRESGVAAEVHLGNYDSIVQDSERFSQYDAVLIFWELSNLLDGFNFKVNLLNYDQLKAITDKVRAEIQLSLENLKSTPMVLFNRFTSLPYDYEILKNNKLSVVADQLNVVLKNLVSQNQLVVDIEKIIAFTGLEQAIDRRQFQMSKSLYTKDFFINYAEQVKPAFLAMNGVVKKVLVLDCDNTLWGGVLGEDGEHGIEMSDSTVKGKSFYEVQSLIKSFKEKGILLALCSKNNAEDVDMVLKNHPDMILQDTDFVSKKVNWVDKATNLKELSLELNLGLESFIFVDDSEFEIGLIRQELPQVQAILVPTEISSYPDTIRGLQREFFTLSTTKEDINKTAMYQEERARVETSQTFGSIDDYLASLGLILTVSFNRDVSVARASQLTQKTNQFNLRTLRYSEVEIREFINDDNYLVSSFTLMDKFGDYGITGLSIVKLDGNLAFFDTFLMSCRVIGRNVELEFFDQIISKIKQMKIGITKLQAEWISTLKNKQVSKFYEGLGFICNKETNTSKIYEIPMDEYVLQDIRYINTFNELEMRYDDKG
jgi:FkbH-like protein